MITKLSCFPAVVFAGLLLFSSCQENDPDTIEEDLTNDTTTVVEAAPSIGLAPVDSSQEFPNAQLSMGNVTATPAGDSVKLSFNFNVKNYELKMQTGDTNSKICNNSEKGQHIHFILDNRPYVALYEPKHETTVAKNTEHYVMAFLSRSYHLSLKNKGAALVYHFKVDENGKLQKLEEPKTPMVFYSRPKGDYLGKDTENVLFDFYVWNATLGDDYKIKADISAGGKDTSMMITEWRPYFLQNMPMGKSTIKLTMVDKDGNKVAGPETEVSRDINLSKDEPLQP
jgi:hypothetical protein